MCDSVRAGVRACVNTFVISRETHTYGQSARVFIGLIP